MAIQFKEIRQVLALKPVTSGQKPLTDCGQNRPLTTIFFLVIGV